jgi:hypothetical protein
VRYGLAELLLVQPGIGAHRPAPAADAPGVRPALALAEGRCDLEHGVLRLNGRVRHPARLPWPTLAARDIIHRLDERRSWWRAYAAAVARSPQARSSAESSTSGGWAPETP